MPRVIQMLQISPMHDPIVSSGYFANPDNTGPRPLCDFDEGLECVKDMTGMIEPSVIMRVPAQNGITMVVVQEDFGTPDFTTRNYQAEMLIHGYTAGVDPAKPVMQEPKAILGEVVILFLVSGLYFTQ